jgi:YidC/Oxa1 family membrane protein insertase
MSSLFHTYIYIPLYNALVGILSLGTWVDMGIAVILLTILVKLALAPLSLKAARTQVLMQGLEVPLREIREKYKDNREELGRRTLALYREKNINPFSSFFTLLIQLPIIFGLYFVFWRGGLPTVDTSLLYSFVSAPSIVDMTFLGFMDMAGKSTFLAFLAGLTQFFQAHITLPKEKPREGAPSFQDDLARSMRLQMRFVLPVIIVFVAYIATAAVALYWVTSNIFSIYQELSVRRRLRAEGILKDDNH